MSSHPGEVEILWVTNAIETRINSDLMSHLLYLYQGYNGVFADADYKLNMENVNLHVLHTSL